ncbi:pyrroline-5-carboxylate reductase [Oceanicola sp. 502str15]|uniref:pyrroline-5-carboxylate reductase n=1 Tax=Oceanicola sp. 502str15 TaxID=2696061 RepID=UPI0020953F2C|nr:pyrroline-5-carboxylate reductase [Oceanicola sp. 502str15]MCO6381094.1 pyrroline-5-carboxylate reductase [Oceanicola sp. 502str15]
MMDELNARGLVLLGCGKMGGAMLAGWLAEGLSPTAVTVLDPNPSDWLKAQTGVRINAPLPESPAVAIIAVKPQMMGDALPSLRALGAATTFISIAAGTPIAAFEAALGDVPVVRAMPNTPAAVGRGISAVIGNGAVTPAQLDMACALLQAVGEVVRLDTEDQIDAVTGVSGSGPAYVFHMIEALAAAGEAVGLAPELAMKLARATVCGAGELAHSDAETSAEQLRINVTSANGTTQAGLEVLMPDLPDLMRRTVEAATNRAKELKS